MPKNKEKPYKAVGYIRLSTEKQAKDENTFERQAEKIRKCCEKRGLELLGIYSDVGSAVGSYSVEKRADLQDAIQRAQAEQAVLIVPEATRLFRNVEVAKEFLKELDIRILSVREGRIVSKKAFLNAVERGEQSALNIRSGTAAAMAQKARPAQADGLERKRLLAAEVSAKARILKSDDIIYKIAHVLKSDPAYRELPHRAFAELLNRQGILTGWSRPWTENGVKRSRYRAEGLIHEWEELEQDEFPEGWPKGASSNSDDKCPPHQRDSEVSAEEVPEYEKHPTFGMF